MQPTTRPRVKICCIKSTEEAWLAIKAGASALGLVSEMPSGPGVISEKKIAEIARRVPPGVATFLLTRNQDADSIIQQHARCGTTTIQLVDKVVHGTYEKLRRALPGIGIVQVIHVTGPASVRRALAVSAQVDAILLDSGNPNLAVKELGGTGRTHDWHLSREIRERISCPLYLAGGLRPENVAAAIGAVRPFGLDLCSGVRSDGKLDKNKVNLFFARIAQATATEEGAQESLKPAKPRIKCGIQQPEPKRLSTLSCKGLPKNCKPLQLRD